MRIVTAAAAPATGPLSHCCSCPSPNPHYHPPSDGASAPFEADENGSWFLSLCLSLRLLVCFFPPALLLTNTRPASAMLVVSRRALFMLRFPLCCRRCRRCADPAALPKLPKLQNTSQLLTPPRIEAGYSIERCGVGIVDLKPRHTSCLEPETLLQPTDEGLMKCSRMNFRM